MLDLIHNPANPSELRTKAKTRVVLNNVFNNVNLAANFFHPKYRGLKFDDAQKAQVQKFVLDTLGNEGLNSFRSFVNSEGIFGKLVEKNVTSPSTFWHFAEGDHNELTTFVQKIHKLERLFSHWGLVHTDLRNRLSATTS